MSDYIKEHGITCPECGSANFTDIRKFNLMFKTFQGVTEDAKKRNLPASGNCPGYFCKLLPISSAPPEESFLSASAQIGKSFRNEITPGNFTFRTREFEQMELEFFCKPGYGSGMVLLLEEITAKTGCCLWE